jgi:hypothetical protein
METRDAGPMKASKGSNENMNPSLSNSFQAFSTEDELFAESETSEWDEQPVDRPDEPEIVYTIDKDLIEGSDYFVAIPCYTLPGCSRHTVRQSGDFICESQGDLPTECRFQRK